MTYLNGKEILDKPVITTVADTTLSGTPVVVIVKDSTGAEKYMKAYPTKV